LIKEAATDFRIRKMSTSSDRYFAPILPGLSITSCLPRVRKISIFPFSRSNVEYFYNARSAIYTFAKVMNLSNQEVLFPAYCCGVDLEALVAPNVDVKFYNVGSKMEVDVDDLKAKIGDKTKAIYLTHYLGFPGPVEGLLELCIQRGMYLFEDCALSLFSCLFERPLGSFGHGSVFSLYKSLPVPSGGVLVFNNGLSPLIPGRKRPPIFSTLKHLFDSLERSFDAGGAERVKKI
jgi:perosamine synthetase